jgi:hypothetical protein
MFHPAVFPASVNKASRNTLALCEVIASGASIAGESFGFGGSSPLLAHPTATDINADVIISVIEKIKKKRKERLFFILKTPLGFLPTV